MADAGLASAAAALPPGRFRTGANFDSFSRYRAVRDLSEALAAPLSPEDQQVQSMPDVSPTKWHLAHVTWYFETFLLQPHLPGYRPFDPAFCYLFNSYYEAVGPRHPRPDRGLLSRPSVAQVMDYRAHVDAAMERFLDGIDGGDGIGDPEIDDLFELGLNHEQQHQELLLMDIKHVLSCNPLAPAYVTDSAAERTGRPAPDLGWCDHDGGVHRIGHDGGGFAFDNEAPRHRVFAEPFKLGSRAVTNGEYRAFIEDGGYRDPMLWHADGWAALRENDWDAPAYWRGDGEAEPWQEFTLSGLQPLDDARPVSHVSYYEAAAYARWAGYRLPREQEWEIAATDLGGEIEDGANLLARGSLHPDIADGDEPLAQMYGDVWEWTDSAYGPYPGFKPVEGAVGEYNGKFMSNQMVLRGGCSLTPPGHIHPTYRNFFYPHQRWMMSGIRLANDV